MIKILLVDDEEGIRDSYRETLEASGYEVFLAQNGHEAIEQYRRERVDVVVMDVLMPKLTGVEAIELLMREFSDVTVIGMSGGWIRNREFFLQAARSSGASETIEKPFHTGELIALINKVLNDKKEVH